MSFPRWTSSILSVNMLFFIYGLQMAWSATQLSYLMNPEENGFSISHQELSILIPLPLISATITPFLFGILSMIIGRKMTLLLLGVPVTVGQLALTFGRNIVILYIGRFLTGIATGGAFAVALIYIAEVSKKKYRGMLISSIIVSANMGKVFGWVLGNFTSYIVFNLLLAIVPVVFTVTFLMCGQESAHFYLSKNQTHMAKLTLEKLRGCSGEEIEREMDEIQGKTGETGGGQFRYQSKTKVILKAILIVIGLLLLQKLCGYDMVDYYVYFVTRNAFRNFPMHILSLCNEILALIISIVSCPLVDVLGRRTCLLVSCLGTALSLTALAFMSYFASTVEFSATEYAPTILDYSLIVPFILYVFFFNFGLNSVPYVILAEIFPVNVKNIAVSVLVSIHFGAQFLLSSFTILLLYEVSNYVLFALYAFFTFIGLLFTLFLVKETKGKSLPEIQYALSI